MRAHVIKRSPTGSCASLRRGARPPRVTGRCQISHAPKSFFATARLHVSDWYSRRVLESDSPEHRRADRAASALHSRAAWNQTRWWGV